jgi:predicted transcriptional regulator
MDIKVPTADELRLALSPLSNAQLQELATLSGVPFHTLRKVRSGETVDPGISTVAKFLPHVESVKAAKVA